MARGRYFTQKGEQQPPMFRNRPLTWLFFIATLCVDLAMVVPRFHSPGMGGVSMVFMFGIPAQLSLVAIWGAIGRSHRLARGAVVTFAIFLATAATLQFPYSWQDLLTFYLIHTLLVFGGTLVLRSLGWLRRWPSLVDRKNEKFRYSVIEMFGWTTIVAIWAFGWRHATAEDDFYALYLANLTAIPLITIALVGRSSRWRCLVILILVACAIAAVSVWLVTGRSEKLFIFVFLIGNLTQAIYLGIWYAVQRFDWSQADSRASLKLHRE